MNGFFLWGSNDKSDLEIYKWNEVGLLQEADQRWIKNNYCVLFITYLENSSPFQQQKITIKNENGIKFEFKRINCLVIDAKRYFTDWHL